ncbi:MULTISPECIES: hypothetical protein [unclassified Pseudonocardia]|uniref:hypothetical protein n=1 Tax=unclassified Pseudonocardia TaxID=2619320 RepID=UPI0001FFECA6|nr:MULTISPECIES: hypothetical protein [unclassified Pseudonocardia]OLM19678.1 hypothetical protein Ae707Ps1_3937c [Pseudonocardia sp. Ae707_Ps1]
MTRPHTPRDGDGRAESTTRRLPATTQRIPVPPTQQIPVRTEVLPESPQDGPTRAMRQVRTRTDDGAWPAIPMLPVIRPDESDPLSESDRVRGHRGMRDLRETVERLEDSEVPAWPEREEPDEQFRI